MKSTLFRGDFCIISAFPIENSKVDRRLLCTLQYINHPARLMDLFINHPALVDRWLHTCLQNDLTCSHNTDAVDVHGTPLYIHNVNFTTGDDNVPPPHQNAAIDPYAWVYT